jgi:hypothetical protein
MGISPATAHCHQTQRYRLFANGVHLVLESSQTMNDIPFGDHFTVESRWDYSAQQPGPDGAPRTLVPRLPPPARSIFCMSLCLDDCTHAICMDVCNVHQQATL